MSNLTATQERSLTPIETALMTNDLSRLTVEQRKQHYDSVCQSLGLNPLTSPFAYMTLNGKISFYAKKEATEQLRKINNISCKVTSRERIDTLYVVTVELQDRHNRTDCAIGAVNIEHLKGEALANAMMKAETKAKRRGTLSISGLAFLDETEVADAGGLDCDEKMKSGRSVFESIENSEKVKQLTEEKMDNDKNMARSLEMEALYQKMTILGNGLNKDEKMYLMKSMLGISTWDELKKKTIDELKALNSHAQGQVISKQMKEISKEIN